MTLRSVDVDEPQIRRALVETTILATMHDAHGGTRRHARPIGRRRAEAIVDAVLEVIRKTGEDLDALVDDINAATAAAELETSRSRARTARVEHQLGLADVVVGELATPRKAPE